MYPGMPIRRHNILTGGIDVKELLFDGSAMYFDAKAQFLDGVGFRHLKSVIKGRMYPP